MIRHIRQHGISGIALRVAVVLVYFFLLGPIVVVMVLSFSQNVSFLTVGNLTTRWYAKFFQDTMVLEALWFSIQVGLASSVVALFVGTLAAFGLVRHQFRGKSLMQAAMFSPMVVPEIITAIALLSFFSISQIPRGMLTLVIGHTVLILPYVISIISARLYGFDRSLEEAALNLGASPTRVIAEITLPLISSALVGGALVAFKVSFDEIVGSMFWSSIQDQTLPVVLFAMLRFELTPEVNVIGTLMIAITLSMMAVYQLTELRKIRNERQKS